MAKINGLELKRLIHSDKDLALRCIPFLLWSTSSASHLVAAAYSCNVQGYFVKPGAYSELKEMVHSLINYWSLSEHPNAA
jgi:DNA-binding NarL/FixJ family response regulator